MKVALLGPVHPSRGGIAQYTTSLYEELVIDHEVRIYSFTRMYPRLFFPATSEEDHNRSAYQVCHEAILHALSPRSWARTARKVANWKPDLLVFQWWHPFFGLAYADVIRRIRKDNQPVVLFLCHNILSHEIRAGTFLESLLVKMAFRHVDGFLVHSAGLVQKVLSYRPTAPVRKVYHPIYSFYKRWDVASGVSPQKPCILFFGNIRAYKGLDILIDALKLVRENLEVELVVAGEFYTDPRPLKEKVQLLGLSDIVSWYDSYVPNEDVPTLFRSAHVVVLPYRDATQSGVVPLAYQFGLPVIASDVGGLSEVVLHGKTGLLFPPGDSQRLAELIIYYFRQNLKDRFQPNIKSFTKRLGWGQVAQAIVELGRSLETPSDR